MNEIMQSLAIKLQSLGALRPSTWEDLQQKLQINVLSPGESFVREIGQIAYVCEGLLKEYDAHGRKRPAIINFIAEDNFLITGSHNQHHYLKACVETKVVHLQTDLSFLLSYKELIPTYHYINKTYAEGLYLRQFLLEIKNYPERVQLFKKSHRASLKYMLKKEMANYLNINYQHLIRIYH